MRNYFKDNSKSSILKEYKNYYANSYSKIKIVDEPSVNDNVSQNEFTVKESYVIDSIWEPMSLKPGFISITFTPSTLTDIFYVPNKGTRKNEMSLPYPVSREHKTNIVLPSAWQIENNNDVVSNDVFYYDFNIDYDKKKNEVQLNSYLKIQKPSVTPDEFTIYYNDITEVEKTFGYTIFIPENTNNFPIKNLILSLGKIALFVFLIIILVIFIVWRFSKK